MSRPDSLHASDRGTEALDEMGLWQAVREMKDPGAREALFSSYADFARQIATRHFLDRRTGDIEHQELAQMAYAGLLESIDRFDPARGVPFRPYAARRISGSILDGIAKLSEVREQISFRNRVRRDRVRSLSLSEADADTMSTADALQALSDLAVGLALGFMLDGSGLVVAEGESDSRPGAYESLAWKETLARVSHEVGALPAREQLILRRHYLEELTFEQIGNLLGVTKGRVSQLHKAAIGLLRTRLTKADDFTLKR